MATVIKKPKREGSFLRKKALFLAAGILIALVIPETAVHATMISAPDVTSISNGIALLESLMGVTVTGWATLGTPGLIMLLLGKIPVLITGTFLTYMVSNIVGYINAIPTTFGPLWGNMRDLTNMFIVLGFLVVGIATILRIQDYAAKKVLPRLIAVAILVNFSGLLVTGITSLANTVFSAFFGGNNPLAIFNGLVSDIVGLWPSLAGPAINLWGWRIPVGLPSVSIFITEVTFIWLFSMGAAWIFFLLGWILAARYFYLVILYVMSPLAFFCWIFPPTRKYFTMWWESFLNWTFLGVIIAFFVYIADLAVFSLATITTDQLIFGLIGLYAAYKIAKKGAPIVVSVVTGLTVGAIKVTAEVVGSAAAIVATDGAATPEVISFWSKKAGKAASKVGGEQAGAAVEKGSQRALGNFAESRGYQTPGTQASQDEKRIGAVQSNLANRSDDELQSDLVGSTGDRREAIIREAVKRNKLHHIVSNDTDQQNQALAFVESRAASRGGSQSAVELRKNAIKANPLLAGADPKQIDEEIKKAAATGQKLTELEAKNKLIGEAFKKANAGSVKEFKTEALQHPEFIENVKASTITNASRDMNGEQLDALRNHLPQLESEADRLDMLGVRSAEDDKRLKDYLAKVAAIRTI